MECPACGRENLPGAARCSGCARSLEESVARTGSPPATPRPANPRPAIPPSGAGSSPPAGSTSVTNVGGSGSISIPTGAAAGPTLVPGMALGTRYVIEAVLGEGGMGMVYKATDRELNRTVALKMIRPELGSRPEILDRFKREILLASQVTHKNVVRIHDLGEVGDLRFISMSYIEGESLRALLDREGPLTPERGVPIVRQVALALQAAHDAGVVHRDLKPHNILIDRDGQPYVGDFGISRSMDSDGTMTETGAILGTVDYMSPEQAKGDVPDHRSDIFSLGVMMFEMFTGSLPFRASNPLSVMVKRVHEDAPQPSTVRPGMPPWLSAIILRAMQRNPEARYQNLHELVRDIDRQRASRAARRRLGRGAALAAAGILAAGLLGWAGMRYMSTRTAGPIAIRTSLAVLPVRNATSDPRFDWVKTGATSVVRTGLLQAKALRLAGDDRVQEVLAALKPGEGEETRPATAQRLGKLTGVENVLAASLLKTGSGFRIEASLMRIGDAALAGTRSLVVDGADEAAIPKMMDDLTSQVRHDLGVAKAWGERSSGTTGLASKSVEALSLYGDGLTLRRAGNLTEAAKRLEGAAAKDPRFTMAPVLLAETYDGLGYTGKAKQTADAAALSARDASPYEAAYLRAVRARLAQDFDTAAQAYTTICDLTPNSPDAFIDLATAQERGGNLAGALESLKRALALDPKHPGALYASGRVQVKMGNTSDGIAAYNAALDLHKSSANDEGVATVLNGLGNAYDALSQFDEASKYFEQSLDIRRRIGDRRGISVSLNNLAMLRSNQGQHDAAVALAREAIETSKTIGYTTGEADAWSRLGDIYQNAGRPDDALRAYQESLKLMREVGDEARLANTLSSVGYVNGVLGRYVDAFFFLKEALAKRRAIGDKREIMRSLLDIGAVEQIQGRFEEALQYDMEGLTMARDVGDTIVVATLSANLSNIHEAQGNYAAALALLADTKAIADKLQDTSLQATAQTYLGSTLRHMGDEAGASAALKEAVRLAREMDNTALLAEALSYQGALEQTTQPPGPAAATLREAMAEAAKSGDRRLVLLARLYAASASSSDRDLRAVLSEIESSGLSPLAAPARVALARMALAANHPDQALTETGKAIEAATPAAQRDDLLQAHHLACRVLVLQRKPESALEHVVAAIGPLEEMRQGLSGESLQRFLGRRETTTFGDDAKRLLSILGRADVLQRLEKALSP
jgi:eukaryotic-like serine/threonine-protein kinase